MSPGTFLHNRYQQCSFLDMTLGDCTLLYIIMRDCTFERVRLNAESVGAILGLTKDQLQTVSFVYLGEDQRLPEGADVVELVTAEYHRRGWVLGLLIQSLNFVLTSTVNAFEQYLAATGKRFLELGFAKGDELQFLGDVVEELAHVNALPLLVAISIANWCNTLATDLQAGGAENQDSLRRLSSRTSLLAHLLVERVEEDALAMESTENNRLVRARIAFATAPTVSLLEVLDAASQGAGIDGNARLVRTEVGSYLEVVSASLFSVLAFQLFLFLINGCLIQLTELKQRIKVLVRRQTPKAYADLALVPIQRGSPVILSVLHGLTQYAKFLPWLKETSLGGFSAENMKGIEILDEHD